MKIGFLITARLKSKRLPNKILRKVEKEPLLSHMIKRIKRSKQVDTIIVCTSYLKADKKIKNICTKNRVNCYEGDPIDVLSRLFEAAKKFKLDYIVNITADCPLVEPQYIDQICLTYKKKKYDLIRAFDLPHGSFCYGISVNALEKVVNIKDKIDTEVWEKYFTDTGYFKIHDLKIKNKLHIKPGLRMTLDYPEDLKFIKVIFKKLYRYKKFFNLTDIITLLKLYPGIIKINEKCSQKFNKKYTSQSNIKIKSNFKKLNNKKYKRHETFSNYIKKNYYAKSNKKNNFIYI